MISILIALALGALAAPSTGCPVNTVSVDPGLATAREVAYLGEDFGQTFVARDSFLTRVVLWLPAGTDSVPVPVTFLLFGADSTGQPLIHNALFTSPEVTIEPGHSAGPVPVVFDLVPAFRLPYQGTYQAAFRTPCGKRLWALECGGNPFAEGSFQWNRTSRCPPWSQVSPYPTVDLAFLAELCDHDPNAPSTPVAAVSWGRVKSIYR